MALPKIFKQISIPLGSWIWSPLKKVPFGFLDISKDNGLLSREAFPQLWETIKNDGNVISESAYQASVSQFGGCGSFSRGDGATTFRLPMIAGLYARAYDPDNPDLALGKCLGDAIRNITGKWYVSSTRFVDITTAGAFETENTTAGNTVTGSSATLSTARGANFDADRVVPTADENRPKTVCQTPIMKVYGVSTDAGEANIAALVAATADLSGKLKEITYTKTLTTSGNWTAPHDGYYLAEIQGAGAGGGSLLKTSSAAIGVFACGGGAGGGYMSLVKYRKRGEVVQATIGAGGNKGDTPSDGKGYSGGNTTFDAVVAQGGNGGIGYVDFSEGRVAATYGGSPNGNGERGGNGIATNASQSTGILATLYSGAGGGSLFGAGGSVRHISNTGLPAATEGYAGAGYGSGGSGGAGNNSTAYGGNGAPGCVRITYLGV